MHLLPSASLESHDTTGMLASYLQFPTMKDAIANGSCIGKGLVENEHKVVLKIIGHTSMIEGCVSDDLILFRDDLHIRTTMIGVKHEIRMIVLGISYPEDGRPTGRSHFRNHIIVGEIYFVVIRRGHFCLMGEPTLTLILVEDRRTRLRHQ